MTVIGTGYLGATHAACMAELGHEVLGVDIDESKIASLREGKVPFFEPGLPELLLKHVESGRLRFTTSLQEAALVDGASWLRRLRSVTLPLLTPQLFFLMITQTIASFQVFGLVFVMTNGGPANASTTLAVWSYREAFGTGQPDFSPAAAVGNVLILVALAIGLLYLQLQRRQEKS